MRISLRVSIGSGCSPAVGATPLFAAPSVIEKEICKMYSTSVIGRADQAIERLYAISPGRRIKHPSVVRITEAARADLFA